MALSLNRCIYELAHFYKSDETKETVTNRIRELSSADRVMVLSIIKKTNHPVNTDYPYFAQKLKMTNSQDGSLRTLIATKDAKLSPLKKVMMNIWRAIKDFFGKRVSDDKLLHEICEFSKRAALEKMQEIEKQLDQEEYVFAFSEEIKGLDQKGSYTTDLTDLFTQGSQESFVNQFIEALAFNKPTKDLETQYLDFYSGTNVNKTIIKPTSGHFGPKITFTMKTLVDRVNDTVFVNFSTREKNMIGRCIEVFRASIK